MFYGFVQPIVPALGYGKAMHEIVMNIHRRVLSGEILSSEDIEQIVNDSFTYLMQILNCKITC